MRLLILLAVFPWFLAAQPAFLKDPDIVWAIKIEQDWVIDTPSLATEWAQGVTTLKLQRTKQDWVLDMPITEYAGTVYQEKIVHHKRQESGLSLPYLADLVYLAAIRKKLPVFRDSDCKIPVDITGAGFLDTLVTFDPVTSEEKISIVYSELDPVDFFKAWRLRQVLAYHKKSATWTTTLEAVAPLVEQWDDAGDSIAIGPFFWFKPDDKLQKLTDDAIVWAKTTRNIQEKTQVLIDADWVLKVSAGFKNPLVHLLQVMKTDQKTPFYDAWNEKPLSAAERLSLLSSTDTMVTFNAQTYEEKTEIRHREINPDSIKELRLLQTWYWDEERHRLSICLEGVGPVVDYLDGMGDFRFSRVPFYRRGKR